MHPNTFKQAYQQLHPGFKSAAKELVAKLGSLGYANTTVSFYEQGAVHFSFWLAGRRISPSQLKESHFADFLSRHAPMCECPFGGVRQQKTVRAGLGHFAAILRSSGYLAPAEPREMKGVDREVRRFDDYMLNTVGLQDATRLYRRRYVREFLDEFFLNGIIEASRLAPKRIVSYLSKRGSRLKAASTKVLATSLRSYFRFLRLHGRCKEDLALAVPAPASWRLASLPPALTDDEIARLLSAFNRGTVAGRRDYAITRCLLDLGLRAQEVARLRLDDVDWKKGILRIVGTKSRRNDELPLTRALGAAIAAYIRRGRPETTSREIFLRLHAPVGQCITRSTIGNLILRAATRAGMESTVSGAANFAAYSRHTDASARRIHQGDRRRAPSQMPGHDRNLYKGRLTASRGCRSALARQGGPMSATNRMTEHVQAYLSLRRAFGFHLDIAGQVLQAFARFADREAIGKPFMVEIALRWAQSSWTGKQVTAARRLLILQPFARYLRTIEPLTEVLPNRLLGPAQYRYIPHVYTDAEIQALLDAAADLRPRAGLRARSVLTYLGLLAGTGMRPREPCG